MPSFRFRSLVPPRGQQTRLCRLAPRPRHNARHALAAARRLCKKMQTVRQMGGGEQPASGNGKCWISETIDSSLNRNQQPISMTSIPTSLIIKCFNSSGRDIRAAATIPCLAVVYQLEKTTLDDVARRLNIVKTTARGCLIALEKAGLITVQRGSNGNAGKAKNIYRLK